MTRVHVTRLIGAPVDRVWAGIRDFNALPAWHPFVATSHIEDGLASSQIGCVRNFQLQEGGATLREQLLAFSEIEKSQSYSILEAPLAVENYVATLKLIEITESSETLGQWQAEFEVAETHRDETIRQVQSIFREGLANLDALLRA